VKVSIDPKKGRFIYNCTVREAAILESLVQDAQPSFFKGGNYVRGNMRRRIREFEKKKITLDKP
jgi:hypothetical protein